MTSTKTYFYCKACRKSFIGKQNLLSRQGHLYCSECAEKLPPTEENFYDVVYVTKRGLVKETTLHVASVEEAAEYTMSHFKAARVASVILHVCEE